MHFLSILNRLLFFAFFFFSLNLVSLFSSFFLFFFLRCKTTLSFEPSGESLIYQKIRKLTRVFYVSPFKQWNSKSITRSFLVWACHIRSYMVSFVDTSILSSFYCKNILFLDIFSLENRNIRGRLKIDFWRIECFPLMKYLYIWASERYDN